MTECPLSMVQVEALAPGVATDPAPVAVAPEEQLLFSATAPATLRMHSVMPLLSVLLSSQSPEATPPPPPPPPPPLPESPDVAMMMLTTAITTTATTAVAMYQ